MIAIIEFEGKAGKNARIGRRKNWKIGDVDMGEGGGIDERKGSGTEATIKTDNASAKVEAAKTTEMMAGNIDGVQGEKRSKSTIQFIQFTCSVWKNPCY